MMEQHDNSRPCARQLLGRRESQEDSCCFRQVSFDGMKGWIMAVADGMGGLKGGQLASKLAIEAVQDVIENYDDSISEVLKAILKTANDAIAQYIKNEPALKGMGSTLLMAVCIDHSLYWLSVGDSVLYVVQAADVVRINEDHSMLPILEGLMEMGRMTREEFENDNRRHQLRSQLNGSEITLLELCDTPIRLDDNSIIIVATDGINTMSKNDILDSVRLSETNTEVCTAVIENIVRHDDKCQDNTTVIVYRVPSSLSR